jgi:hypothetical protein
MKHKVYHMILEAAHHAQLEDAAGRTLQAEEFARDLADRIDTLYRETVLDEESSNAVP